MLERAARKVRLAREVSPQMPMPPELLSPQRPGNLSLYRPRDRSSKSRRGRRVCGSVRQQAQLILAQSLGRGTGAALAASAVLAAAGTRLARLIWPSEDWEIAPDGHDDLPADHPHLVAIHAKV